LNEWSKYVFLQYLAFIVTLILLVTTTHCTDMVIDTSLEDGTNLLEHVCIEYEHVREFSKQ